MEPVPNQYKTQKMCYKAVNYYPSTILIVSECHKTPEMCDKVDYTCFFVFKSAPDRYKTQGVCDKAVDNYAHALEFVSD